MRHKVNLSQVRVDTTEMCDFSPAITPHSLSSGVSNLTTKTPQPDETTPLSLDLNSADITRNSAANVRFADVIKYKKVTLTGIIFLIFFMCSYMFLLGRQDMNNQLQYEDSKLLKFLAQKDNILSDMTMEENDLLEKIKLLLDRLDEKEDILSTVTNEKNELVDKVAHLKEENYSLRDENDDLKERVESAETENSALKTAQPRPTNRWWQRTAAC